MASTTSLHEPHYDVLAAAVAGASATMLTLMTVLGSVNSTIAANMFLKDLFEVEILVLEVALITGLGALIKREDSAKKNLSHASAGLLIVGTLLLWLSATLLVQQA
jgi:hypothetical protein